MSDYTHDPADHNMDNHDHDPDHCIACCGFIYEKQQAELATLRAQRSSDAPSAGALREALALIEKIRMTIGPKVCSCKVDCGIKSEVAVVLEDIEKFQSALSSGALPTTPEGEGEIRDAAVEIVDWLEGGYTMEFAPCPAAHAEKYDEVERIITATLTPPTPEGDERGGCGGRPILAQCPGCPECAPEEAE